MQLDLYRPQDHCYEYKVIVTNKRVSAKKVLMYHNGRGAQEGVIGKLKQSAQFDYLPFHRQVANQLFTCTSAPTHNLNRKLQMLTRPRQRGMTEKREACWIFRKLATLRQEVLFRVGRLAKPNGRLTLAMSTNEAAEREIRKYLAHAGWYLQLWGGDGVSGSRIPNDGRLVPVAIAHQN